MGWFSVKPREPGQYFLEQAAACERAASVAEAEGDNEHAARMRGRANAQREMAKECIRGARAKAAGVDLDDMW